MEANNENPIIQLVGLGKQFQTMNGPVTALEDINLEIRYGEVFGIIGLSGAGKSTLVRCINYLEVPTSGKVVFEGKNLSVMKDREKRLARQSMGMIFQQFNLLSQRNVLQNVCFPLEIAGVSKAEAKKAGRGAFNTGGSGGPDEGISGAAFRRTETEGSHCQGHGNEPKGPSV